MRIRYTRSFLPYALACAALSTLAARADEPAGHLADVQAFDQVWRTIHEKHWDPRPGGQDWEALRDELRPRVEQAATREAARAVIEEMLDRLGQSHFGIIPGPAYEDLASDEGGGDGTVGLDVRVVEGHALVTSVDPGSAAERGGVHPGWIVDRVGAERMDEIIERLATQFAADRYGELALTAALRARLSGAVGEDLSVAFIDARGRRARRRLALEEPPGTPAKVGLLPPIHVRFEQRMIHDDAGYIRFNMFVDPGSVMPAYNEAMERFREAAGVVVDLRGNPGGIMGMAMGMAGWFVGGEDQRLGTMYMRGNELKVVVFPRPHPFAGRVAVLVDGLSASCSEILAGGLQDLGRARVFGSRTIGAALPSVIEELPNGDRFQYAIAHYVSQDGEPLEGKGVVPDVEVAPSREALLAGGDPALDAALAWIHEAPRAGAREVSGP